MEFYICALHVHSKIHLIQEKYAKPAHLLDHTSEDFQTTHTSTMQDSIQNLSQTVW